MQRARASWLTILLLVLPLAAIMLLIRTAGSASVPPSPTPTIVAMQFPSPVATNTARPSPEALPPTNTPRPSPGALPPADTPRPPQPTRTASATPSPSRAATLTRSPTATITPTAYATLVEVPLESFPTAVPAFARPSQVTNIALLGNDAPGRTGGRTDSIIIVSINHELRTATLLSLPRDLYVPVPGWRMARINQALPHGNVTDYPGGGGGMLKDTILYNFGIPVDYYLRIGFDGFKRIVDTLGGVTVAVTCQVRDWRLIEPDLDPQDEENWEMYTLETGIHHMDGDLALWYVRSRRSSSDFDRGRRQQQVLRAIFNRGLDRDLIARLPELWEAYRYEVETDLTLPVMLQLATLAPDVRENGIQHLYLPPAALRAWTSPGGGSVQLLQWPAAEPVLARLMQPPLLNHATRPPITVEVVTPYEFTYRLAAETLAWHGFAPVRAEPDGEMPGRTQVTYFGENRKGSFDWLLGWLVDVNPERIILEPAPGASDFNYRVVLGYNYDSCRPELEIPSPP